MGDWWSFPKEKTRKRWQVPEIDSENESKVSCTNYLSALTEEVFYTSLFKAHQAALYITFLSHVPEHVLNFYSRESQTVSCFILFTLISTFTTGSEPSDHAVPFSINKLSFLQLTSFNMIYYICIESLHGFLICVYIKRLQWFKVCPFRLRILNFSLFYSHKFSHCPICASVHTQYDKYLEKRHTCCLKLLITSQETHKT